MRLLLKYFFSFLFRSDPKEYALKQIEGSGLSMSACREIAVSNLSAQKYDNESLIDTIPESFHLGMLKDLTPSVYKKALLH